MDIQRQIINAIKLRRKVRMNYRNEGYSAVSFRGQFHLIQGGKTGYGLCGPSEERGARSQHAGSCLRLPSGNDWNACGKQDVHKNLKKCFEELMFIQCTKRIQVCHSGLARIFLCDCKPVGRIPDKRE